MEGGGTEKAQGYDHFSHEPQKASAIFPGNCLNNEGDRQEGKRQAGQWLWLGRAKMAGRQAFEATAGQEMSRAEADSMGEEGHKVTSRSSALKHRMQAQKYYR